MSQPLDVRLRERKVDVNSLTNEEVDNLAVQIGEKTKEIADRAAEEANRYLKIYGLKAQVQIAVITMAQDPKKPLTAPKKKRGRQKKDANL